MIIAGMATIPERGDLLCRSILSLSPQVDLIHLYLSNYEYKHELPERVLDTPNLVVFSAHDLEEPRELGDAGKFFRIPPDCYYLSCDDDIYYGPEYVQRMIRGIEYYGREAWVTLHGSQYISGKPYSKSTQRVSHFATTLQQDTPCMIPGTGVSAFHTSLVRLPISLFKYPNCADMWIGYAMQYYQIPCIALSHKRHRLCAPLLQRDQSSIYSNKDSTREHNEEIARKVKWAKHIATPAKNPVQERMPRNMKLKGMVIAEFEEAEFVVSDD